MPSVATKSYAARHKRRVRKRSITNPGGSTTYEYNAGKGPNQPHSRRGAAAAKPPKGPNPTPKVAKAPKATGAATAKPKRTRTKKVAAPAPPSVQTKRNTTTRPGYAKARARNVASVAKAQQKALTRAQNMPRSFKNSGTFGQGWAKMRASGGGKNAIGWNRSFRGTMNVKNQAGAAKAGSFKFKSWSSGPGNQQVTERKGAGFKSTKQVKAERRSLGVKSASLAKQQAHKDKVARGKKITATIKGQGHSLNAYHGGVAARPLLGRPEGKPISRGGHRV